MAMGWALKCIVTRFGGIHTIWQFFLIWRAKCHLKAGTDIGSFSFSGACVSFISKINTDKLWCLKALVVLFSLYSFSSCHGVMPSLTPTVPRFLVMYNTKLVMSPVTRPFQQLVKGLAPMN